MRPGMEEEIPWYSIPNYCVKDEDIGMIPFLSVTPNPTDVGLPPNIFPYDSFDPGHVDEFTAMHDTEFEMLVSSDLDLYDNGESSNVNDSLSKFLMYDCKWSGCDPECAKTHNTDISFDAADWMSPNDMYSHRVFPTDEIQPYTPDNDHCYSAPATKQVFSDVDDKLDVLKNIPTPPSTSESPSETSSEDEVDVVTVPEEYPPPLVVTRFEISRRNTRPQRNTRKPQRTANTFSARSLKAAMKRTRVQNIRKTYRRRKVYNSVETTPSSSMPSSAQSSRCNSDVEDLDKRENHNCSERKRREAQRTALQNLRVCIPDLQGKPKAPKVLILNSATALCRKLKLNKRTLKELKLRELQRRSDLTAKLNQLRIKMNLPPIKG